MAAENEVAEGGVCEVGSSAVTEKCGLEMGSYQDLPKPNGIEHISGDSSPNRDSIDNSYVVLSGGDGPVDVVTAPLDLVASPETSSFSNHVHSKESIIMPNGNSVEPVVPKSDGIAEESGATVESQNSMEEKADVVVIAATYLETPHDGGLRNTDAESEEDQTETEPSFRTIGDQAAQVASTDSPEQPIGAATTESEAEVVLETSIQPAKSQESKLVLSEANTGVEDSMELKGVSSFVDNHGDRSETTEEAVSQDSSESPDRHDSLGVGFNMNAESSQWKDLERVGLGVDYNRDEYKENMIMSLGRSDELPDGLDSRGVVLVSSAETGQGEGLEGLAPGVNSFDNHSNTTRNTNLRTSDELSLCQDSEVVISKVNVESGESKDLDSMVPGTNNTNKESKETMVTMAETSDDLAVDQDSRDMELVTTDQSTYVSGPADVKETSDESNDQSRDVSGPSDVKETSDEYKEGATKLEECTKLIVVQECEAVELKQDPESHINKESITSSINKQREISDGLTEAQGAPNIVEADGYQLEEAESEKSNVKEQNGFESFKDNNEEHECQVVSLEAPSCQSEDVKIKTQSSDLQHAAENSQQSEEVGSTLVHDTEIVPQHDELCELTDASVNFQFGSLGSETEMKSKPDQSDEISCLDTEAATTDHDVQYQASTLSDGTKSTDDVEVLPVGDSSRMETDNKPGKIVEGFSSDCQDITIVHENDLHALRCTSAEGTDDASACPFHDTRSGNIEPVVKPDDGVTCGQKMASSLVNEAGLEAETFVTIDSRARALDVQDDADADADADAEDKKLASEVKASSALDSMGVHTISDAMATMVSKISDVEGASNLSSGMAEVESTGDDLNGADKSKEVHLISQDIGAADESQSSEVSADLTGSSTSATARRELEESVPRPFNFLVKIPRFDDDKLREQIRLAQLEVDEKTQHRDAFRVQIQKKRPYLHALGVAYDAAVSEEIDARKLLKATRMKIESLQSLIGRMKNAISVEDIDARIHNIEHRMQHETMSLKEEKQSIREIKQLKQHREYLSSNIGSQDEIQQALDQKDQNEDRMKALKKELVGLKEKVSTAQAAAATVGKRYEVENKLIQELQNQYRVANDVRQAAYKNLLSFKKKIFEKNEYFRKYKNDVAAANDYALSRNKIALHRLCVGQMEMMMELWNNDEEFREEYIRCNLRSTVRRLGTVDGRSLGLNEEPPMLPSYAIVRVDRSTSYPDKSSSVVETAMEKITEPKIATVVAADYKPVKEVTGSVKQTVKMLEPERSRLENGLASSSGAYVSTDINGQNVQEKEAHESARKVEDLHKEVETANLKEQDRLDEIAKAKEELERKKLHEIAKAKEALERKKRIAEKAQIRAELRAQKEAEQREKEREKRLKKKERRRGAGEDPESSIHGEIATSSEVGIETVREPSKVKENPAAVVKRPQKTSQFVKQSKSKPIPPPLRNRNRKKLQQWMWVIVSCVLVIILFLLGNIGVFSKIRSHRSGF